MEKKTNMFVEFKAKKDLFVEVLKQYKSEKKLVAIWGANNKGEAFLNIVDKKGIYIDYAIDINADKRPKRLGKTDVISCNEIVSSKVDVILLMNQKHIVQNLGILEGLNKDFITHDVDKIVRGNYTAQDILDFKDMEADTSELEELKLMTRKVQKALMPLLYETKRVCEENDITYFLCAGSALGAVRHKGFIPWDDDIDVGMLRADYDRFLHIAREKLESRFSLYTTGDAPNYYAGHAKIFMNNSALVNQETAHLYMPHGMYLDIFPFDSIPNDEIGRENMYTSVRGTLNQLVAMRKWKLTNGLKCKWNQNKKYYLAKLTPFTNIKINEKIYRLMTQYKNDDTDMVADLTAPYNKRLYFKKNDIVPVKIAEFEGDYYPIPANVDAYLTVMYGNYMILPPEGKRYVKHDIICFETDKPYEKDIEWMKKYRR